MDDMPKHLSKIIATNTKNSFGTSFVQRICKIGYEDARKVIDYGLRVGKMISLVDGGYKIVGRYAETESSPLKPQNKLCVGDYKLSLFNEEGDVWIEHASGEGIQVFRRDFEELIDFYYKNNF